jgi:uncharacterized protein YggE
MGLRRDWIVMMTLGIVSTAVMLTACGATAVSAQVAGFIEVTGTGSVAIEADRAHVSFAVETRFAAAAEASAANADAMESVLGALRSAGLEGLRIATFGYSLRPEYVQGGDRTRARVIDGYTAVNNVRATISDVESVGTLIDLAIQSGANRISAVSFSASSAGAAQSEALTAAVEDARSKAMAIASALGKELGDALEVRGGSGQPTPNLQMSTMEVAARVRTPVEAGDQIVRANVTVRFALGSGDSPR